MVCQLVLNLHIYVQLSQGCLLLSNSLRLPWKALMVKKFSVFYGIPKVHYSPHKKKNPCQLTLFWATLIQSTPWQHLSRITTLKRTPWSLPIDKQKLREQISPLQRVLHAQLQHSPQLTDSPKHEADHYTILSILFLRFLPHIYDLHHSVLRCPLCQCFTTFVRPWPGKFFFMRRGPGPNKFTRKYLSIFFKFKY